MPGLHVESVRVEESRAAPSLEHVVDRVPARRGCNRLLHDVGARCVRLEQVDRGDGRDRAGDGGKGDECPPTQVASAWPAFIRS
jgi:hypothetical protein